MKTLLPALELLRLAKLELLRLAAPGSWNPELLLDNTNPNPKLHAAMYMNDECGDIRNKAQRGAEIQAAVSTLSEPVKGAARLRPIFLACCALVHRQSPRLHGSRPYSTCIYLCVD